MTNTSIFSKSSGCFVYTAPNIWLLEMWQLCGEDGWRDEKEKKEPIDKDNSVVIMGNGDGRGYKEDKW